VDRERGERIMARRKKKRSRKQGFASWATSAIALLIGFSNVIARLIESAGDMATFGANMIKDYTGYDTATGSWAVANAARGILPIIGGVVFKKASSMLIKSAKMSSPLPSI